jgi:DNA invertase Pin-like site-specific DNA recombinase
MPHGRLMLTVLGGLAEFERDLIPAPTGEGEAQAVARGVKLGRKPKLTDHQKREAIRPARCQRRDGARDRAQIRRRQEHDFEADGITTPPLVNFTAAPPVLLTGRSGVMTMH